MHRNRDSRLARGRALPSRTVGGGDGRAGDALRGAWSGSFGLRQGSRGQRPRTQADANRVVNLEFAAGRIARLFSDKQDCRRMGRWPMGSAGADLFLTEATLESIRLRIA